MNLKNKPPMNQSIEVMEGALTAFIGYYGTQKEADDKAFWSMMYGVFAIGWIERGDYERKQESKTKN